MTEKALELRVSELEKGVAGIHVMCPIEVEKVKALDEIINGNGKDGLILKVDRLIQNDIRRARYLRIITAAVMGILLKSIFDSYTFYLRHVPLNH